MLNGRARGDAHETMLDNRPMYSCLMVALRMEAWLMSSDGGKNDVTGRYYRGRYVAKLEPLCNHHALNHGYAFVTSPCVVYFSTAHRQQQALFAQWSLYLPHRRYLPDLHLGALDVQLPGLVDAR